MDKNNRRDRQTTRARWFDYRSEACYFITICTHERQCTFGQIINAQMILSDAGRLAQKQWLYLPERFPGVTLDEYIIMPDHIHGIVSIYQRLNINNMPERFRSYQHAQAIQRHLSLQDPYHPPSIGQIMRAYKAATSHLIRTSGGINFGWQQRFYEKIIPDHETYQRICKYIIANPQEWPIDNHDTEPPCI